MTPTTPSTAQEQAVASIHPAADVLWNGTDRKLVQSPVERCVHRIDPSAALTVHFVDTRTVVLGDRLCTILVDMYTVGRTGLHSTRPRVILATSCPCSGSTQRADCPCSLYCFGLPAGGVCDSVDDGGVENAWVISSFESRRCASASGQLRESSRSGVGGHN